MDTNKVTYLSIWRTNMERKVLDYLELGSILLRKCQTGGIIGGLHSSALRLESLWSVVELGTPYMSKPGKVIKSYKKAERQLLYERVRNQNRILYIYEHNIAKCNSQLRNLLSEEDLFECISFINKIKEHRCNKIKRRQINKFKHLVQKSSGYSHNFGIPLGWCAPNTANDCSSSQTNSTTAAPDTTTTNNNLWHPGHPQHPLLLQQVQHLLQSPS